MIRISMGYPDDVAELAMISNRELTSPLENLKPIITIEQLAKMIETVRSIHVSSDVEKYAVTICQATRHDRELRLGASPRATLHLVKAAKAKAALAGRDFVLPDDIDALAIPVLAHRLISTTRRAGAGSSFQAETVAEIVKRIVSAAPVPLASREAV